MASAASVRRMVFGILMDFFVGGDVCLLQTERRKRVRGSAEVRLSEKSDLHA